MKEHHFPSYTLQTQDAYALTWIKSSLESKTERMTFFPSWTRVTLMCNLPLTLMCASSGNTFSNASRIILFTSKVGWNGPSALDLASVATLRTSLVLSPAKYKIQGKQGKSHLSSNAQTYRYVYQIVPFSLSPFLSYPLLLSLSLPLSFSCVNSACLHSGRSCKRISSRENQGSTGRRKTKPLT